MVRRRYVCEAFAALSLEETYRIWVSVGVHASEDIDLWWWEGGSGDCLDRFLCGIIWFVCTQIYIHGEFRPGYQSGDFRPYIIHGDGFRPVLHIQH